MHLLRVHCVEFVFLEAAKTLSDMDPVSKFTESEFGWLSHDSPQKQHEAVQEPGLCARLLKSMAGATISLPFIHSAIWVTNSMAAAVLSVLHLLRPMAFENHVLLCFNIGAPSRVYPLFIKKAAGALTLFASALFPRRDPASRRAPGHQLGKYCGRPCVQVSTSGSQAPLFSYRTVHSLLREPLPILTYYAKTP